MKKGLCILILVLMTQLAPGWPVHRSFADCTKSYRVRGTGNDGQPKDFVIKLRKPQSEPAGFDPVIEENGDAKFYASYYQVIGPPTFKQNCAGLVVDRLWGIKGTYFSADQFYREIVTVFGRPVSGSFQTGDVVVFGSANHVAYVTGSGSTRSQAMIDSKDNQEAIIHGELNTSTTSNFLGNDPIKKKNGSPTIYRLSDNISVNEVTSGDCDPAVVPDLLITIDVNELLRGKTRELEGAAVSLKLSNGEVITGKPTDPEGKTTITISDNPAGRVAIARGGLTVTVTLTGFEPKTDSIPGSLLSSGNRMWSMTLTRTKDNPPEADPNIPPESNQISVADWEKKLKELEARIAAAETKKTDLQTKLSNTTNNAAKTDEAEKKAAEFLESLRKLKDAVARVKKLCEDASKTSKELDAVAKKVAEKEKAANKLSDDLKTLIDKCVSKEDLAKIKEWTTNLQKFREDLKEPVKEAKRLNDELIRLSNESLKELPELSKGPGFVKGISEQDEIAAKAMKDAMDDDSKLSGLESDLRSARLDLSSRLVQLRTDYPVNPMPEPVEKRLDGLEGRIEKLVEGLKTLPSLGGITTKYGLIADHGRDARDLVRQYQADICTITARDNVIEKINDSVVYVELDISEIAKAAPKIKECEERLDCDAQIKKVNEALDNGDLEGATSIIAKFKGPLCDTSVVEARWQKISDKISFELATARNKWRDIASTCDYRAAYEAALVIQKQYPKHPWIVQNFEAIERGYKAEQQIRTLVTDRLVPADRDRNYDEAEKILAQIDQIAAAYPCMVAEAKKLRTQYGKGKAASPETEKACRDLISQIRAAIGARKLVDASQKLERAKKDCSNVSPAVFTDLQAVDKELEQAIQQAINDIQGNVGKCEFEGAYDLAQQIQQLRPAAVTAAQVDKIREQAKAQADARQFLQPGLDAIKQKDIKGAIGYLRQAKGVRGLPACLLDNINSLLQELEKRQSFTDLTEQVQRATQTCDYKEASRLIGQIKLITPREDYITNWLKTNEQILSDLQTRERNALDLIRQADAMTAQAEAAAAADQVDTAKVALLGKQAMDLVLQADKEAPKCMPQRQQMESIRKRIAALAQKKKAELATSIVLLIDTSGSMGDNNKINQAKDAARRAARQVSKTTEIAILHFDGGCDPGSMRPATGFTTDLNTLLNAINGLSPGGGTPMYISTAAAVKYAQDNGRGKSRTIILMSDGGDTCRDQQAKAADAIRSSNIPVSTIGFDVGNNQQAQGDLTNLATMTGGRTFSASAADPREIIRAFNLAMLPSLLKDFDFGGVGNAVSGYFTQAKSMVQQQNISGALMMLQQANNLAPSSPNLNYNLSLLYEADDQLIPAVNHANNYLKLAPNAIDSADVQNRINDIQQELQKNPRVVMDSSGCRDILTWSQTERDVARRSGNATRTQAILEIAIVSQRGECEKARQLANDYKGRYR